MRWYAKVRTPKDVVTLKVKAENEKDAISKLKDSYLKIVEIISISNTAPINNHNKFSIEEDIGMDIEKPRFKKRHSRATLIY